MVKPVSRKIVTYQQTAAKKAESKIPFKTASLPQKVKSLVNRATNQPVNPKKDKLIDAIARRATGL